MVSFFDHIPSSYSPGPPASSLRMKRMLVLSRSKLHLFFFPPSLWLIDSGTIRFLKGKSHSSLPYVFRYLFPTWTLQAYFSVYFQSVLYSFWNALFLVILLGCVLTGLTFYFSFLIMTRLKARLTAFSAVSLLWVTFEWNIFMHVFQKKNHTF